MKFGKDFQTLMQIFPLLLYFLHCDGASEVHAMSTKDSPEAVEQTSSDHGIKENVETDDQFAVDEHLPYNLSKNCMNFFSENSIEDLKIVNLSSNSLTISWKRYINEVPIDFYRIRWYKNEKLVGNAVSYDFNYTIENLEACTTYKIRVGYSIGHYHDEYKEINATTCTISPSECVNLVANPLMIDGGLQLNISWEAPLVGRTCVKHYKVVLEATIHGQKHTESAETNGTDIRVKRLYACTSYSVVIHAVDVDDEPGLPAEILAPPTLSKARRPPRLVNKINVPPFTSTSTTITLNWDLRDEKNNCSIATVKSYCQFVYGYGKGYELKKSDKSVSIVEANPSNISVVVDNLSPFTRYNCWGFVITVAGESSRSLYIPDIFTRESEPSAPEDFRIVNVEDFTFSWRAPDLIPGRLRKYRMTLSWMPLYPVPDTCTVSRTAQIDNIDGNLTSYTWSKGEGYSRYDAYIEAQTKAGWGSTSKRLHFDSNVKGIPDEVTNLRYTLEPRESNHNILEAKLWWNLPCSLKGILSSFDVQVHGYKDDLENHTIHILIEVPHNVNNNDEFGANLGELKPEYNYIFEVAALIHDSMSKGKVARYRTVFPAGIPPEPKKSYMQTISLHPNKILRTTSSFEILLPLFADSSGDVRYYAVIVSRQDSNYEPVETRFDLKEKGWPNVSSWRESMEHDFKLPYQVTEPYWSPYPNYILDYGNIKAVKFVVGNDITCKDVSLTTKYKLYCNGPLNPDTWYEVRMRSFTSGGYSDSPPILVKTKAEISAILIVSIVLGLLVLGMILSMIIAGKIYFKRKEKNLKTLDEDTDQGRRQSRRMTLTASQSGISQDASSRVRRH